LLWGRLGRHCCSLGSLACSVEARSGRIGECWEDFFDIFLWIPGEGRGGRFCLSRGNSVSAYFFTNTLRGGRLTTGVSWYHLGVLTWGGLTIFPPSIASTLGPRTPPPLTPPLADNTSKCLGVAVRCLTVLRPLTGAATAPARETCCVFTPSRCSSVVFFFSLFLRPGSSAHLTRSLAGCCGFLIFSFCPFLCLAHPPRAGG